MTAPVIDIDKNKPVWDVAACACLSSCTHAWVAVIHKDAPRNGLECPQCRQATGMVQALIKRSS